MASKKNKVSPSLSVDISAKAELRAELKAEVPHSSMGRLVDSLTDAIRPFTESRGLRADQIRLQREEVLIKIAHKARQRLAIEQSEIKAIPNKALIPFLEKASLEDGADEYMVDLWANLLASSAATEVANMQRYASVLSEINGRQARLLEEIITHGMDISEASVESFIEQRYYVNESGIVQELKRLPNDISASDLMAKVDDLINNPGVAIDDVIVFDTRSNDEFNFKASGVESSYADDKIIDFEILESLNLVKHVDLKNIQVEPYEVSLFYYVATIFSVDLFACCNPGRLIRK